MDFDGNKSRNAFHICKRFQDRYMLCVQSVRLLYKFTYTYTSSIGNYNNQYIQIKYFQDNHKVEKCIHPAQSRKNPHSGCLHHNIGRANLNQDYPVVSAMR